MKDYDSLKPGDDLTGFHVYQVCMKDRDSDRVFNGRILIHDDDVDERIKELAEVLEILNYDIKMKKIDGPIFSKSSW